MSRITGIVVWLCKRFNRQQIKLIINELSNVLNDPDSDIKPKDAIKETHPNYRDFRPDPNAALTEDELPKAKKKRIRRPTIR